MSSWSFNRLKAGMAASSPGSSPLSQDDNEISKAGIRKKYQNFEIVFIK
jgi:hypothetical protein